MTKYQVANIAGILLAIASPALAQTPLGTAFTYQGQLKDGGTTVNGAYDLRFRLYDEVVGGSINGPTVCHDNVSITDGLFTVSLDFGVQFAGQERYLEVAVRGDTGLTCGSVAGFIALAPRQPLTGAPNALFALTAASASNAFTAASATNATQLNGQSAAFYQNAGNLTGTLPGGLLSGSYTGALTFANPANDFTGSGAGLTNLNASGLSSGNVPNERLTVPFSLSGTVDFSGVILGANGSGSGYGVFGYSLPATGETCGTGGESVSTSGTGVLGIASATSGDTRGVRGVAFSPVGRGVLGVSAATSGFSVGVQGESSASNPTGTGIVGKAQATGGWFEANGNSGTGLYGVATASDGHSFGLQGRSDSWQGTGVYGEATSPSGFTFGGYFVTNSENGGAIRAEARSLTGANNAVLALNYANGGTAVKGEATAADGYTYGVYGKVNSPGGNGVYGLAYADAGNASGVVGQSWGSSGSGVVGLASAGSGNTYGIDGSSNSTTGIGVRGQVIAPTGSTHGVYGRSDSTSGHGVTGWATASSGFTFGVLGECSSPGGNGVRGANTAITGSGTGVYGKSSGPSGSGVTGFAEATTGTNYGVLGATSSSSGWAIYAQGRLGASGTKSFRIDHPADPESKYLLHYSAESPEVINFYRGSVTLDGAGTAIVELPAYFVAINRDPSYTLTAVGVPMPMLHVAEEISGAALEAGAKAEPGEALPVCSFRIAGGAPGSKVSWRIEAVRNDRWVRTRGAPVEVEKDVIERGTYQHPEYYGFGPEMGMADDPESRHQEHENAEPAPPPAGEDNDRSVQR